MGKSIDGKAKYNYYFAKMTNTSVPNFRREGIIKVLDGLDATLSIKKTLDEAIIATKKQ